MTDAAIIALATSGAGVTILVAGALLWQSLKLSSAKDDLATTRSTVATLTEQLKAVNSTVATLTADLKTANARVEALDAENQKLRAGQPVAGSFDRLRAEAAAEAANRGHGAGGVSDDKASTAPGPDDLLDPAKA